FSHPGGTFSSNFNLTLTTNSPTADIYYTTNGVEPTSGSTLYTSPITINNTKWVRAIAYDVNLAPSLIESRPYIKLASDVQSFESNLPIVIIDSFGLNIDNANRNFHPLISTFIDTDEVTGRAAITDSADYSGYGGMHIRGNSTEDYPKRQFRFETWDENRPDPDPKARYMDENVSLLGLPSESDWIIHGPWSDRTLMRNYQMYTWSNLIGRYASRTVFVEVFLDYDGNGTIDWDTGLDGSSTDYRGVYVLMEKIKRDDNRVDIARLLPSHNAEPEITGGYLLERGGGLGFETLIYNDYLSYADPEADELTTAQKTWITNYFNTFETALSGSNFSNPAHADYYGNYIDIGSFVDHHILVETAKNVDGIILSTYLFKDRGGKINMGSIWDYNGSLGGADYGLNWNPEGWLHTANDCTGCLDDCCFVDTDFCPWPFIPEAYAWYVRLFEDSEFLLKYADQWYQLREGIFATASMIADINNNYNLLTDGGAGDNPVVRNYARWDNFNDEIWPDYLDNQTDPGCTLSYPLTYTGHVNWLKDWLTGDYPPEIFLNGSPADEGGHANVGDSVTMTSSGGTIYYTTDGNDPREHGGSTYAGASAYSSAITLTGSEQFKARINNSGDWSALNEATFAVGPVADNLRITEIMYHPDDAPSGDPNGEFIELKNISGGTTINLNQVKFTNGIDFTFPDIDLGPSQYVVVVVNPAVFTSEYPSFSGINAGKYTGRLSNAGER
ncbi:MAG: CotH kinase family protein, partial [Planctomycetota bacterium]